MDKPAVLINEFFSRMHYGTHIQYGAEDVQRFGLALLMIVSVDGLSDRERWAHTEIGRHVGAPDEMIQAVYSADLTKLDLAEVLEGFSDGTPARTMLYDAITIASVDGYSDEERAFAARAAEILGIEPSVLKAIESLVETERALRNTKAALLLSPASA